MALPTNKIKQVKLPDNTVYQIVPEMLGKNGYSAELPTLTANSTIALTSNIPTNYVKLDDTIQNTNPFGGRKLYINSLDNAFADADKKYWVTITRHKKSDNGVTYPYIDTTKAVTDDDYYVDGPVVQTMTSSAHQLFDGSYESKIAVGAGYYLKIRIMFGSNTSPSGSTSYWSGYPYGTWYLSYYYNNTPEQQSQIRVYNKYAAHTVGWHLYTTSNYVGSLNGTDYIQQYTDSGDYQRTCVDFIIFGNETSGRNVCPTEIDYKLQRPDLSKNGATVTKYGPQTLYEDFTWNAGHQDRLKIQSTGAMTWYDASGTTTATISSASGDASFHEITEGGTTLSNKYAAKNHTHDYPVTDVQTKTTSSGSYTSTLSGSVAQIDLSSYALKSELPTVNNATLTLKAGSNTKTFTANQGTNETFEVTASDLGLSQAMKFIGVSTTDPASSGATVSGHTTWAKGEIVIYKRSGESHYEEYINIDGNNTASSWELLGDSDSYALSSVTVTGTGVLGGGGNLTTNRTITHNEVLGTAKTTAGIYSVKIDKYGHISEATSKAILDSIGNLSSSSMGLIKLTNGTASIDTTSYVSDVKINNTSIVSSGVANFVTNTAYNASSNKIATMSDIPTVNNATLTVTQNSTSIGTFTANASSNVTIDVVTPQVLRFI